MRIVIVKTGILAAGLGLVFSMAAVAASDEQTPEARAYLSFSFGGEKPGVRALHYGLRLDHDRFSVPADQPLPALMQLDFSRRGLSAMQVNGLNVLRPAYRVSQNEEPSEAAAEEEEVVEEEGGFFDGILNFFGGLFGGDEEEEETEVAQGDTAGDEAAADDEMAEGDGTFLSYDAVDWGLMAVAVAGIGFITTEVAEGNDDANPQAAPAPPPPPCDGVVIGGQCVPPLTDGPAVVTGAIRSDAQHQEWLDSGTGQMGDLHARD